MTGTTPTPAERIAQLSGEQRIRLIRRLIESGQPLSALPRVVPARDPNAPIPLSPGQEHLWVFESLYPQSAAINLCGSYHFDRPVDADQLEQALTLLHRRHDVLRTSVSGAAGELTVRHRPVEDFRIERMELHRDGRTLEQVVEEFRTRPFDLTEDPLLRALLVRLEGTRSVLLLSLHHLITDWYSFDVLHTEFARAYQAITSADARAGAGTDPGAGAADLGRPVLQYADFACWQRELEQAGVLDAQLDFWRRYLADLPAPLTVGVPVRGGAAGFGTARCGFQLDAELADRVRGYARAHNTTVYGVLISAFAVLVHRLSGAGEFLLGTPAANRDAEHLGGMIGYIMNVVTTRWRIDGEQRFDELTAGFAATFPQIIANSEVPLGRIVGALAPERSSGRSPLFQWVFMHLPGQASIHTLPEDSRFERIHTGGEHDCMVVLADAEDGGMNGGWEYRSDLFAPESVLAWTRSLPVLLDALLSAPGAAVGELPLLDPEDRRQALGGFAPASAPSDAGSLSGRVASWAAAAPDSPALEHAQGTLSYAALDRRVTALAGSLAAQGAVPGAVVAICLPPGAELIESILAVDRAGAAYMPVDPSYPAARIEQLLTGMRPVLVVCDAAASAALPAGGPLRLLLEDARDAPARPVPAPVPDLRDPAYVIHTSGSTGAPKGVVVTRAGLAELAAGARRSFELEPGARVAKIVAPGFDVTVLELLAAFGCGGTLVLPPDPVPVGEELAAFLTERRIDFAFITPTVLATVPPLPPSVLPKLGVGAEGCPPELVRRWSPGRRMINVYGPTECTVVTNFSEPLGPDGAAPLGRPLPGVRAYVLDSRLQPVLPGVIAELYLAGPGLARGYGGRPGLTAERFLADPYGAPGERMYRTGDLATRAVDGTLHHVGRTDDQVKLRGIRIEPGEIAAVLAEHPAVRAAAAILREDRPTVRALVAYAVADEGTSVEELRGHLATRLPRALVPAAVVLLDALPTTPNGKLDRAALPSPGSTAAQQPTADRRAPRDQPERTLCTLYAQLLGLPEVGIDEGFFDLGGDSIKAIQLVSRARTEGLRFTPADVFTAPAVAELVRLATVVAASSRPGQVESGPVDTDHGEVPLSPIMYWWRDDSDIPLQGFALSLSLEAPPGLDRPHLLGALRTLLDRHGALRMRLTGDSRPQWGLDMLPPGALHPEQLLTRIEAQGWTDSRLREEARRQSLRAPIDPTEAVLLHLSWFDRGPATAGGLVLTLHHLACDGVSLRILGAELKVLLSGGPLADSPRTTFRAWARQLRQTALLPETTAQLPLWQTLLGPDDIPRLASAPGSRSTGSGSQGDRPKRSSLTLELPPGPTEPLLNLLPGLYHCGPDAILLTGLVAATARWRRDRRQAQSNALLVQLESHGRGDLPGAQGEALDLVDTVGWFTSAYPVRLDLGGPESATEFWTGGSGSGSALKRVKESLRAVPGHGLGFGLLHRLNPETAPRMAALPVPQVCFNYLGRITTGSTDGAELLGAADGLIAAQPLELDVLVEDRPDGPHLIAGWGWETTAFPGDEIPALAELWFSALGVLAEHAQRPEVGGRTPSDFPLAGLSQDQLDALEQEWAGL